MEGNGTGVIWGNISHLSGATKENPIKLFVHLFTFLFITTKENYEVGTSKKANKTNTYKQRENNSACIIYTVMIQLVQAFQPWSDEKKYTYIKVKVTLCLTK